MRPVLAAVPDTRVSNKLLSANKSVVTLSQDCSARVAPVQLIVIAVAVVIVVVVVPAPFIDFPEIFLKFSVLGSLLPVARDR